METEKYPVARFLEFSKSMPLLDIRSPSEYLAGHIPGAISFPLFSNDERAAIGTLYKQDSQQAAIRKGFEIVGPKMVSFIDEAKNLGSEDLAMYCWRGGMRSGSMAWLLEKAGFRIRLLEGGYKQYRRQMIEYFSQDLPLIVLTGYTGSMKTGFLQMLKEQGAQVVDLEGLAGHQGSSFGNRKSAGQPTSEHFQNLIYEVFTKFDLTKPIWIEDECLRIGQVTLIDALFYQMNKSPHLFLEIEKAERIDYLLQEYGNLPLEKLIEATLAIQKKLGTEKTAKAIESLKTGSLKDAVSIILTYYDSFYNKSITNKASLIKRKVTCKMQDLASLAITLQEDVKDEI